MYVAHEAVLHQGSTKAGKMQIRTKVVGTALASALVTLSAYPAVAATGSDPAADHPVSRVGVNLAAPPAFGACSNSGNGFEGEHTADRAHLRGVDATIDTYNNPILCTPTGDAGNATVVFSLIGAAWPADPGLGGYAQVGYGGFGSKSDSPTQVQYFVEWCGPCGGGSGTPHDIFNMHQPSGATTYAVVKEVDGGVHFLAGSYSYAQVYHGTSNWASSWHGVWAGEIHYHQTDILGTSTASVDFGDVETYDGTTGIYSPLGGSVTNMNNAYNGHRAPIDLDEDFEIWSNPT